MQTHQRATIVFGLSFLLYAMVPAFAADAKNSYPDMAPIDQYRIASAADEVALARSAAPASIADNAEVLTLGDRGYETAAKGKNGFVCLVLRSWAAGFDDAEFWNPKLRGPICLNPAAAHSVLPNYVDRTQWVLAGVTRSQMMDRTRAAVAANTFIRPQAGAMGFMMSKQGYLGDAAGHWHPHLMFYLDHTEGAAWGANLEGSPVYVSQGDPDPTTTFVAPVPKWSDGTSAVMETH